jgi:hypothetical protein
MYAGYEETESNRARDERAYEEAMEERDRRESLDDELETERRAA